MSRTPNQEALHHRLSRLSTSQLRKIIRDDSIPLNHTLEGFGWDMDRRLYIETILFHRSSLTPRTLTLIGVSESRLETRSVDNDKATTHSEEPNLSGEKRNRDPQEDSRDQNRLKRRKYSNSIPHERRLNLFPSIPTVSIRSKLRRNPREAGSIFVSKKMKERNMKRKVISRKNSVSKKEEEGIPFELFVKSLLKSEDSYTLEDIVNNMKEIFGGELDGVDVENELKKVLKKLVNEKEIFRIRRDDQVGVYCLHDRLDRGRENPSFVARTEKVKEFVMKRFTNSKRSFTTKDVINEALQNEPDIAEYTNNVFQISLRLLIQDRILCWRNIGGAGELRYTYWFREGANEDSPHPLLEGSSAAAETSNEEAVMHFIIRTFSKSLKSFTSRDVADESKRVRDLVDINEGCFRIVMLKMFREEILFRQKSRNCFIYWFRKGGDETKPHPCFNENSLSKKKTLHDMHELFSNFIKNEIPRNLSYISNDIVLLAKKTGRKEFDRLQESLMAQAITALRMLFDEGRMFRKKCLGRTYYYIYWFCDETGSNRNTPFPRYSKVKKSKAVILKGFILDQLRKKKSFTSNDFFFLWPNSENVVPKRNAFTRFLKKLYDEKKVFRKDISTKKRPEYLYWLPNEDGSNFDTPYERINIEEEEEHSNLVNPPPPPARNEKTVAPPPPIPSEKSTKDELDEDELDNEEEEEGENDTD